MATTHENVLQETFWNADESQIWLKRAVLIVAGIATLTIAAKIRIPMWPVPGTLQTMIILLIGSSYGLRLGVTTVLAYLVLGAIGLNVFTGSSAESYGLAYMAGPTGGYLVGFLVAAAAMGALARKGWDRTWQKMALSMLVGTAIIYAFGLTWMSHLFLADKGAAWVVKYGITNFLVFDAIKLAIAAMVTPMLWKMVRGGDQGAS